MGFLDSILGFLFGQRQPQVKNVYQQTYGGTGVGTTNFPTPISNVSKPRRIIIRHHRISLGVDPTDFARGYSVKGYTTAQLIALARAQAPRGFIPHDIAQEGTVRTDSRGRYIRVKFSSPTHSAGSTTENVYLH